jgi:hypothetical protein
MSPIPRCIRLLTDALPQAWNSLISSRSPGYAQVEVKPHDSSRSFPVVPGSRRSFLCIPDLGSLDGRQVAQEHRLQLEGSCQKRVEQALIG